MIQTDNQKANRPYNLYNIDIIRRLRRKYGTTSHFIYASLRGDRNSETSTKICQDYKSAEIAIYEALEKI